MGLSVKIKVIAQNQEQRLNDSAQPVSNVESITA